MLDVRIYSIFHSSGHGVCTHLSGQYAVLGKILIIAGAKGRSVGIHAWCIPAVGAHFLTHLAHALSPCLCHLLVPGRGNHYLNGESHGTHTGKIIVDGRRSVKIQGSHFPYRLHGSGLISCHGDHLRHLVYCQLIQKRFPPWIVIIRSSQVSQFHTVFRAGNRHSVIVIQIRPFIKIAVQMVF